MQISNLLALSFSHVAAAAGNDVEVAALPQKEATLQLLRVLIVTSFNSYMTVR